MKSKLSVEELTKAIRRFHDRVNGEDEYTRYKSWEYCYNIFHELWDKPDKIDYLSLHLSWYLASWGMLRGSSFLLKKDYKVHYKIIEKLTDESFRELFINPDSTNYELIFKASEIIRNGYGEGNKPTDTLITKILLGIFGCTPAYDRFFKASLTKYELTTQTFNIESLTKLREKFSDKELEDIQTQYKEQGIFYPIMKLVDMGLFQLGMEEERENKKKI